MDVIIDTNILFTLFVFFEYEKYISKNYISDITYHFEKEVYNNEFLNKHKWMKNCFYATAKEYIGEDLGGFMGFIESTITTDMFDNPHVYDKKSMVNHITTKFKDRGEFIIKFFENYYYQYQMAKVNCLEENMGKHIITEINDTLESKNSVYHDIKELILDGFAKEDYTLIERCCNRNEYELSNREAFSLCNLIKTYPYYHQYKFGGHSNGEHILTILSILIKSDFYVSHDFNSHALATGMTFNPKSPFEENILNEKIKINEKIQQNIENNIECSEKDFKPDTYYIKGTFPWKTGFYSFTEFLEELVTSEDLINYISLNLSLLKSNYGDKKFIEIEYTEEVLRKLHLNAYPNFTVRA